MNQELSEAKSNAEAANQSKTRFLAAVSHDLMQPLNAARLVLRRPRPPGRGCPARSATWCSTSTRRCVPPRT
ncbi:hypothetical protein ACPA9J_32060 [Pseudomonas aeruginosa]